MLAGPNSARATFLQRPAVAGNPGGVSRGAFHPVFTTWAAWRYVTGNPIIQGQDVQDEQQLEIRLNDNPRNRQITIAWRMQMAGAEYAIASVSPPDRAKGEITLRATHRII